jgi:hypothetical protein
MPVYDNEDATRRDAASEVRIRGLAKSIRIPEFVAYNTYAQTSLKQDAARGPLDVLQRCQVVPREVSTQGVECRFSRGAGNVRCQVPSRWPPAHAQIDEGLRGCIGFTKALIDDLQDLFGTVWG